MHSPNQVLTHAARAAAKQLFRHLWWPRAARAKGSGQSKAMHVHDSLKTLCSLLEEQVRRARSEALQTVGYQPTTIRVK